MDSTFRRSYAAVEEALGNALGTEAGQDAGRLGEEVWAVARAVAGSAVLRRSLAAVSYTHLTLPTICSV